MAVVNRTRCTRCRWNSGKQEHRDKIRIALTNKPKTKEHVTPGYSTWIEPRDFDMRIEIAPD